MFKYVKNLYFIIKHGMYDDDPMTSIFDEILVNMGFLKGPYAKVINNVLKQYSGINPITGKSNFSLGTHILRSDADVWAIKRGPGAKSDVVLGLADEIEESLTRVNCFRRVSIEAKPLRVILYHKKPTPVYFKDWLEEIDGIEKNKFFFAPAIHWKGKQESLIALDVTEEKFCQFLVAGVTGSGKSQLLLSMMLSLAITNDPQHVSMIVIDPKGIDFARGKIARLPHLSVKPIVDLNEAENAIHEVRLELEKRMVEGDSTKMKKGIFIFCDEITSITEASKKAVIDLIFIVTKGRAWNIHLIAATQRPTQGSIDTTLRSQLVCNLTGSVTRASEASYASGHAESGADRLPGHGAFILNCPQYFNHRVQGLLADDYKWIVDIIVNEYKDQEAHFKLDNEEIDTDDNKVDSGNSVAVEPVSRVITRREDFVKELITKKKDGEVITDTKVRQYHKEFYNKGIDGNASRIILDYVENAL